MIARVSSFLVSAGCGPSFRKRRPGCCRRWAALCPMKLPSRRAPVEVSYHVAFQSQEEIETSPIEVAARVTGSMWSRAQMVSSGSRSTGLGRSASAAVRIRFQDETLPCAWKLRVSIAPRIEPCGRTRCESRGDARESHIFLHEFAAQHATIVFPVSVFYPCEFFGGQLGRGCSGSPDRGCRYWPTACGAPSFRFARA